MAARDPGYQMMSDHKITANDTEGILSEDVNDDEIATILILIEKDVRFYLKKKNTAGTTLTHH